MLFASLEIQKPYPALAGFLFLSWRSAFRIPMQSGFLEVGVCAETATRYIYQVVYVFLQWHHSQKAACLKNGQAYVQQKHFTYPLVHVDGRTLDDSIVSISFRNAIATSTCATRATLGRSQAFRLLHARSAAPPYMLQKVGDNAVRHASRRRATLMEQELIPQEVLTRPAIFSSQAARPQSPGPRRRTPKQRPNRSIT